MSSRRKHVISCRVTEKLRLSLWTLWLFELAPAQLFEPHSDNEVKSVSVVKGMAAQAAAVLRDKRKRWERFFVWFSISFVQNYFCGSAVAKKLPFLNPTPALPVREEEAKRRWRTTPRYRSVTISPEKTLSIPKKISLCILSNLSPSSYFSLCAEACDLYDGGQFNGNCLQI